MGFCGTKHFLMQRIKLQKEAQKLNRMIIKTEEKKPEEETKNNQTSSNNINEKRS